MSKQTFVIVGASLAGAKAAQDLREHGLRRARRLIGTEPERPYERPPLTKDYLRGESDREKAYVHAAGFYDGHDIELMTGTTVTAIDPARLTVTLDGGGELAYDRLLLTTGAEPRPNRGSGRRARRHLLPAVAGRLRRAPRRLDDSGRVAVVGAGWIGSEFAASARQLGLEVTVIDPLALPNERIFGPEIGAFYRDVHAQHGVELLLGDGRRGVRGRRRGRARAHERRQGRRVRLRRRRDRGRAADRSSPRDAGPRGRQRSRRRRAPARPRRRACSRRATSPAPGTRSTSSGSASSTGPTRSTRVRPRPARCSARTSSYDRIPYFFSDQYDVGMEYSGYATELGRGRVPRRPRRRGVHRVLAERRPRRRRHERQRVGRQRARPGADPLARSRSTSRALTDPDTPLDSLVTGSAA